MDKILQRIELTRRRQDLQARLDNLLWGSVEIRSNAHGQRVYLHRRESGVARTIYVGETSDQLTEQINRDNVTAREVKRQLRLVDKQLLAAGGLPYNLPDAVQRNVDLAKRNLVNTIYDQAILEDVAVTFADTETIVEGGRVNGVSADDVQKVNNLKHAWQLILDEGVLQSPSDFNLLCLINRLVIEGFYYSAGELRDVPVRIGGANWQPPIPLASVVYEQLGRIDQIADLYDRAIAVLLYIMRAQLFIDGNKRTAVVFANHILISHGAGLLTIPDSSVAEFKQMLVKYYETGDSTEITKFLSDNCLTKI